MLAALPFSARAQSFQFLPEIDTYYQFDPNLRVYFQAKDTREGGLPITAEIGPSLDFHLKSLQKLGKIAAFDLDQSNPNCCCSPSDIQLGLILSLCF